MARKLKFGPFTLDVPAHLVPPKAAGRLSSEQVKAIPRARAGIGLACDATADALENEDLAFTAPTGITAEGLRMAGRRAEEMDLLIAQAEGLLEMLKQGNLLFDAEAFEMLSTVNDQVKAQGKRDKSVITAFGAVRAYFRVGGAKPKKKLVGG